MRSKTPFILLVLLALVTGWALVVPASHRNNKRHAPGQPGVFDYYVLALSWSPEFCHSHPASPECEPKRFGFVVHGLWPQYVDGYPEHCSTQPGLSNPASMTDIMPDASLVEHEWTTHGTCSGLSPDGYFRLVRQAFASVKIPPRLSAPRQIFSITPQELKEGLLAANPRLKAEDLTVSCGNNYLTGISVCLDKQLQSRACEALRDCRASSIRVAPVR